MTSRGFLACRFDGRSAESAAVIFRVEGGILKVEAQDGALIESGHVKSVVVSERFRETPRLIRFRSGSTLEVDDKDGALARALENAGLHVSPVVRLQGWWQAVVVGLAGLVALMALAYFKGLPIAAKWAAERMPHTIEQRMGEQVLAVLDENHLDPSTLPGYRHRVLTRRFAEAAAKAAPSVPYRLEFRATEKDLINAFALPGGIIVLLDGLVKNAANDDAVLGVLGHELGHIVHKHNTRQLLQSTGVGILAGLLWGDFSHMASSVPVVLGMLHYSRGFEAEADEFAIHFLHVNGMSAKPLRYFFVALRAQRGWRPAQALPEFLTTHPSTDDRINRLEKEIEKETARPAGTAEPGTATEENARDGDSR